MGSRQPTAGCELGLDVGGQFLGERFFFCRLPAAASVDKGLDAEQDEDRAEDRHH